MTVGAMSHVRCQSRTSQIPYDNEYSEERVIRLARVPFGALKRVGLIMKRERPDQALQRTRWINRRQNDIGLCHRY